MQIQYIKIADLKPYDKNPRKNNPAVDKVAASIKEFGFQNPVIVDKDLEVVAGHTRLKAAKKLKIKEVPVIMVEDLTPEQIKAYRIADNKTAELAEWDNDLLIGELNELKLSDYNLELTGFDLAEIDKLMGKEAEVTEDDFDADAALADITEPTTKRGDIWQLGRHRLMCGDSTMIDDVDRLMDGVIPGLMVTDPPYGVEYDPDWRNRADRANGKPYGASAIGKVQNDSNADWRDAWALFQGDICYVWHAGKYASKVQESLEVCDFEIRSQIIWAKSRFAISRGDYHWQHEPCWYAVRKGHKGCWSGDRSQTTLWNITHNKSETGHGTQKPLECMARPIQNNSNPGQAVYDPFGGSGTTLMAAEQLNRICYMMELDEKYCDVIIQRWETYTGQKAVRIDGEVGGS